MQKKYVHILVIIVVTDNKNIEILINSFFKEYYTGIYKVYKIHFDENELLLIDLLDQFKIECLNFLNENESEKDLYQHLFYIFNDFCKKNSTNKTKNIIYTCPGCLSLDKESIVNSNNLLECDECKKLLELTINPIEINLYKTFAKYNKYGYKCNDCSRFIPHPLNNYLSISCPYFDCCFVGEISSLKKMKHPFIKSKIINNLSKDKIIKIEIDKNILLLKEIIESEKNNILYNSSEFTVQHKKMCFQAFSNLLNKYSSEMIEYLIYNSRSGGFQHKIFQEYIRLLEESMPYSFRKNNKNYTVTSLLDDQLNLFDGISVFDAVISDKLEIKNGTKEYYIGGRKAAYTKPFYIGKLLDIKNKNSKESIINNVSEYSFSKIKMKNVNSEVSVIVTHLRIPPHYQMGGMVYVNRAKKKIVENLNNFLKER